MFINSLYTKCKWAARFFILAYLLLITSTVNAFWCVEAETNSHLESNPAATCWFPCTPAGQEAQRNEQPTSTSLVFYAEEGVCLDSSVHSSGLTPSNQKEPKSKTTATEINISNSFFALNRHLTASLGNHNFTHQLPPRQALIALRTIALLC